jgi:lysophospholipase L1-like esterase
MPRNSKPAPARIALASSLALMLAAPALAQAPLAVAAKPAQTSPERYEKDIRAFEAADKATPPPQGAILFVGASSTRLWKTLAEDFPDAKVINRGFGGSQTSDLLHFADRIVTPYKPRLIVVQEGGNDINAGKSPEQVLADHKALVAKIRKALPDVRIAFTGVNPSPLRWAQAEKQKEANRLLKEYAQSGDNLDFIELWDQFLGPDGQPRADLFVADRLHNNAAGYKVRAEAVRPHLR